MASNRKYPSKMCQNPACESPEFIPHDKRQVYCTRQCQNNYNNDKKTSSEREISYQRKLEQCDQRLAYIYNKLGGREQVKDEMLLQFLKIDLSLGREELDSYTGATIRWYIHYGVEYIDEGTCYIYSREELLKSTYLDGR